MKNNKIRILSRALTIILLIGWTSSAFSQFAGPDLSKLLNEGDTLNVNIGQQDLRTNVCYTWTQVEGIVDYENNKHNAVIELKITEPGTYVYHVKRVSSLGVEEDEVVVKVRECPEITRFEPKIHCLNDGDEVKADDFIIETDPPEYQSSVTLTPHIARNWTAIHVQDVEITAELPCDNGEIIQEVCQIEVRREPALNIATSANITAILNGLAKLEHLGALSQKVSKIFDKINNAFGVASPCRPAGTLNFTLGQNMPQRICCNGEDKDVVVTTWPAISTSMGINCLIPFAGAPKVAAVYLELGISAGLKLGPFTKTISLDDECTEKTLPLTFFIAGNICATGALGPEPDYCSVSGCFRPTVNLNWNWVIGEELNYGSGNLTIDLALEFKLLGGVSTWTYRVGTINF